MKTSRNIFKSCSLLLLFFVVISVPDIVIAQEKYQESPTRDTLIAVAREIMDQARYCALITVDSLGQVHARTMDPFPPDEGMVVWLGTNIKSRKVLEIRNNKMVTLYYADPDGGGYMTINGTAMLVNDPKQKIKHWKGEWESFYDDRDKDYILIKVTPMFLDVLSYKHGITGNPETWRINSVEY